jgi:hypothetical protein
MKNMKMNNPLRTARILIAIGLLMTVLPTAIKDFSIIIPNFFRGLLAGLGLGLEVVGLVLQRNASGARCRSIFSNGEA